MSISPSEGNSFFPQLHTRQIRNVTEKKHVKGQSSQKGVYKANERMLSLALKKNTHLMTLDYHCSPGRGQRYKWGHMTMWRRRGAQAGRGITGRGLTGDSSALPLEWQMQSPWSMEWKALGPFTGTQNSSEFKVAGGPLHGGEISVCRFEPVNILFKANVLRSQNTHTVLLCLFIFF